MDASRISKVVIYVSAFDGDASRIGPQRGRVELISGTFDAGRARLVVDVGWPDEDALCPPGLFGILRASRVRAVGVVAVETIGRFARDRQTAVRIATMLCDCGVQIREAARAGPVPDADGEVEWGHGSPRITRRRDGFVRRTRLDRDAC